MKGTNLGEFEEYVMLTVAILNDDAYGYAIQKEFENRTKRRVNLSSIHATLFRLEEKCFIKSKMGEPTFARGGKRKKYFSLTPFGVNTLHQAQELRKNLWKAIPKIVLQGKA